MNGLFRGLGANVVALGVASFFTDVSSEAVFSLMPAFLTGVLGGTAALLGFIEGAADALAGVLRVTSGWISDRVGRRKPLVLLGYGLSGAVRPLVALATAAWHAMAVRLVDRVGKGLRLAARDALIAGSCEPGVRGKAFGLQKAMDHLGAAIGPTAAAALLASGVPVRTVFWLSAIPAAVVLFVIGGFVKDVAPPPSKGPNGGALGRAFAPFLAVVALFTLSNVSVAFLLLRAPACGVADAAVPLVLTGINVVRGVVSLPAGMLADRVGRRTSILLGWLVYAAAAGGFAASASFATFVMSATAYALYHALAESAMKAHVAELVPAEALGRAYGTYYLVTGAGSLIAGSAFGAIWDRWGAGPAFGTSAVLALLAAAAFALRRRPGFGGEAPL